MRPLVGSMSRLTIFMVVVLPQPDGPTSTQISPSGTSRVRSSTATLPLPKRFVRCSSRITSEREVSVAGCAGHRAELVGLVAVGDESRPAHLVGHARAH